MQQGQNKQDSTHQAAQHNVKPQNHTIRTSWSDLCIIETRGPQTW